MVAAIRLWFLRLPLIPDEAGFYLVAKDWSFAGPHLYGHYFVDRPPGLLAIYKVATLTGHTTSIRLIALVFALLVVVLLAWTAHRIGAAVLPTALTAAAFVANPVDESVFGSSGMMALPFAVGAIAALVAAVTSSSTRASYAWAGAAGLSAIAAMSVKQNFMDGFVFALVALLVLALRRELPVRRAVLLALSGLGGTLLGVALMLGVALAGAGGVPAWWLASVSFRFRASEVIVGSAGAGTTARMLEVLLVLVVTGMVTLTLALVWRVLRGGFRGSAWAWAAGVTLVVEVASIAAGGSYWPHYALQLVPTLALGAGIAWRRSVLVKAMAGLCAVSTLANAVGYAVVRHQHQEDSNFAIARWVATSAKPGDTATVLYGHAEIQLATGMWSPYSHLWSLPARTLDPHLDELVGLTSGPDAPTWVVAFNHPDSWHLDASGRLRAVLEERYQPVGRVCGRPQVWLLRSATRELTMKPRCTARFREPDWYVVRFVRQLQ